MKKYTDTYGLCPQDRKSKWFMQTDVRGIAKQNGRKNKKGEKAQRSIGRKEINKIKINKRCMDIAMASSKIG